MATKIRRRTSQKQQMRFKHKKRIRARLEGTPERPRLVVFRSNKHVYVQVIDDLKRHTIAAASTSEADFDQKVGNTLEGSKRIGNLIAKRALAKNVKEVVFDRGGYIYHGRVRAIADAAREGGLKF